MKRKSQLSTVVAVATTISAMVILVLAVFADGAGTDNSTLAIAAFLGFCGVAAYLLPALCDFFIEKAEKSHTGPASSGQTLKAKAREITSIVVPQDKKDHFEMVLRIVFKALRRAKKYEWSAEAATDLIEKSGVPEAAEPVSAAINTRNGWWNGRTGHRTYNELTENEERAIDSLICLMPAIVVHVIRLTVDVEPTTEWCLANIAAYLTMLAAASMFIIAVNLAINLPKAGRDKARLVTLALALIALMAAIATFAAGISSMTAA